MLLIDDPDCAVIEPLFDETDRLQKLYDIDLMENGGHLTGWFIPQGALTDQIEAGLANLADRAVFNAKYGVDGSKAGAALRGWRRQPLHGDCKGVLGENQGGPVP